MNCMLGHKNVTQKINLTDYCQFFCFGWKWNPIPAYMTCVQPIVRVCRTVDSVSITLDALWRFSFFPLVCPFWCLLLNATFKIDLFPNVNFWVLWVLFHNGRWPRSCMENEEKIIKYQCHFLKILNMGDLLCLNIF